MRTATVERKTRETEIAVSLDLDGTGESDIDTGIGFLDHMLESFSRHSMIDLKVRASGDLHVDYHHTTEDTAIVIGQAVKKALAALKLMRLPVAPTILRARAGYQSALESGRSAEEIGGPAGSEIASLWGFVERLAHGESAQPERLRA